MAKMTGHPASAWELDQSIFGALDFEIALDIATRCMGGL